jgi:lysophospholipase L1-like esterase
MKNGTRNMEQGTRDMNRQIRNISLLLIFFLLGLFNCFSQGTEYPFASDIRQFKINDSITPPPQHAILFAGSSSFTKWKDVQDYFPGYTIINRGFGGSTLPDLIRYADDVIFPYFPRQIVIYCGENDLAYNDTVTADMVYNRFVTLFNLIRSKLPEVQITYISMKPSPSRWNIKERMIAGNDMIREFLASIENTGYVSVWDGMLISGKPDPSIFLQDSLHMNAKGYHIWQKAIQPELIQ